MDKRPEGAYIATEPYGPGHVVWLERVFDDGRVSRLSIPASTIASLIQQLQQLQEQVYANALL